MYIIDKIEYKLLLTLGVINVLAFIVFFLKKVSDHVLMSWSSLLVVLIGIIGILLLKDGKEKYLELKRSFYAYTDVIKSSSSEDDVIKWEYNYEQLSQRSKLNIRYIKDDIIKSILIVLIIIILNRLFFLWSITDNYYFLFIEMTLLTVYVYYANIRNLDLTSTSFKTVMFLNNYIVSTNKVIILNTPDYKLKNISYNKKTSEIILHFFDFEYSQDRILEVIYVPPDKKFIVDEIINKYKSIIEKVST